ncbi:hypothetical protein BD779DRAFT_1674349 [Infundibulicybe gibba]|nr:hypothetical protein BD779DRAFT_1674349 [Infundibulicybe gibba]
MESAEELQELEITALKSIYAEDFIDCPPPRAWKDAVRQPEFIIRIRHPDPNHAASIFLNLHVKFPKTYPSLAFPMFTIQKPIGGLNNEQITKLAQAIHVEVRASQGSEMVFQIASLCQEWISTNVTPTIEPQGSLALQMIQRAEEEQRARQQRAAEEAKQEEERATREAQELSEQIRADAIRQQLEKERQYRARKRANSEATEVPVTWDTPTETFSQEVEISGVRFNTVKIFHPRLSLGMVYLADPVCDDINTTLPLELFVVTFESAYYSTSQGKKKIKQVTAEIQRLTTIRHPNLLSVFAVKLNIPHSSANAPQLLILTERGPALTLQDVLEDCDSLREDRASDYLGQILSALNAIHAGDLVHRGINARCIALASRDHPTQSKLIKLGRVGFYTRLLDLHRSNPFGTTIPQYEEQQIPDAWLSRDEKYESSLLYTRQHPKTPMPGGVSGSPRMDYFRVPPGAKHTSRWKEDWEELELLGKGAFGSVVKAKNKIDSRIYAVKKIRLKTMQSDTKIFREVNALSRLSHRFIVRYYTTWVETAEAQSTAVSDDSGAESSTDTEPGTEEEDGMTSVPETSERYLPKNGQINFDLDDLDTIHSNSGSFPSIHFGRSSSPGTEDGDSSGDGFDNLFVADASRDTSITSIPMLSRTLYIQMEFVERQTLKERIDEGLAETEAWRLFQQILDALVHMSSLGILHRDIKLTNIFIDAKGDCKVGDFGLATSSLAAVDPSDVSPHAIVMDAEMTLEVGTRLYIAPEVQSRKRGPRNHTKADMYSLGIVFFEMNFTFSTTSERIAVIEDLRKAAIFFPPQWEPHRTHQREIITWLLKHDPDERPTALQLSESSLLPTRLEDEYFKGALMMMAKPDSPHHQAVLSSLFNQPPRPTRGVLYDLDVDTPEHAALNGIVQDRLAAIFRLHGAVNIEPPLLMPANVEDDKTQATLIDRHGDVVMLPNNLLVPFARLAARTDIKRIKRYHIANIYRPNLVPGHPVVQKAAVFDIITPDLMSGPIAAGAEVIAVANDCLDAFPNLAQNYDIHISHSKIVELILNRIPSTLRSSVLEILAQQKSPSPQKRALLLKKGLLRSTADELEILAEADEDIDDLLARLEKISPNFAASLQPAIIEMKETIQYAISAGVVRPIIFHLLMLGVHHAHFQDGVLFEVVRKGRRMDTLAAGGRYDNLISKYDPTKPRGDSTCAIGFQIAVEKITSALASFQSTLVKTLVKEERSFGFWSPRRCDVYVVSYHPGYLQDRLEVASYLWQHKISADIMYESGLPDAEHENHVDLCAREGILFTVYPRPRTNRRDHAAFKVKSILKGTEYELSRQELVGWLQQQIAEQKRVDAVTAGAPTLDSAQSIASSKDIPAPPDIQLLLPVDAKKQRKQVKSIFLDRAFETSVQIKSAAQTGIPMLAVDVSPAVFDAMIKNSAWVNDEDAWKSISSGIPPQHSIYAQQIREAAAKRKTEGHPFILLFAVREERVQLLTFT